MNLATTQIITALKKAGYNPVFINSPNKSVEDDSIRITDKIEIQICRGGKFSVGKINEDSTLFCYAPTKSIDDILANLKDAI